VQLEHAYPRATPWEIWELARGALIMTGEGDGHATENLSCDGNTFDTTFSDFRKLDDFSN